MGRRKGTGPDADQSRYRHAGDRRLRRREERRDHPLGRIPRLRARHGGGLPPLCRNGRQGFQGRLHGPRRPADDRLQRPGRRNRRQIPPHPRPPRNTQARRLAAHLAQPPQLRGRPRSRTDEVEPGFGGSDEIRRDDPLHAPGRRTDGLHPGRHAQRHAQQLPPLQLRADEPGYALPPAGPLCRAGIPAEHALRLPDELPPGARVHALHRRDPDRLG